VEKSLYGAKHEALRALLHQLREERRLRQVDLAQKLGEHHSFISRYESGQRRLDLVELQELCRALEVELRELVRRFEKGALADSGHKGRGSSPRVVTRR
jgi:transcriptional regulator with XRE-family HTH domain